MNETQLRYTDICDKTNKFCSRLRHNNSKSHKHKKDKSIVVKEAEFINQFLIK